MKIFKYLHVFLFVSIFSTASLFSAEWTVLVYVQARNNLSKFALKNLSDMSKIGSSSDLNILVQWYQPDRQGVWRYKIEKDRMELDSLLPCDWDGTGVEDLVDSMRWAASKYPAKQHMLVLWNHGVGILDPVWNGQGRTNLMSVDSKILEEEPRIQLEGVTKNLDAFDDLDQRGILFNEQSRTYMNNQQLAEALRQIKTNVLGGKKIDVLGMDACLMAMLEVGYQIKDYADYLVASQEVELANGWDYQTVLGSLLIGKVAPVQLVENIVLAYEHYYKNKIQFYTQSAVRLENIGYLKDSVDQIVDCVNECKKYDRTGIKNVINDARKSSLQFSTKSYVDLYSLFSQFHKKLEEKYANADRTFAGSSHLPLLKKSVESLKGALNIGMKVVEGSVVAKTSGKNFAAAKGISIYFPSGNVDNSYFKTEFAKDSLWLDFIKTSLGN